MRQKWIDNWRGILILLVVIGHVAGGAAHMTDGISALLFRSLYRVIYMFHMPAFFFLAGIVWSDGGVSFCEYVFKKACRLLVPYYVWGVISLIVYVLFSSAAVSMFSSTSVDGYYGGVLGNDIVVQVQGLIHGSSWPSGNGLRMNSVLWFLPCMFSLLVIYRALNIKSVSGNCVVALVCVVLSLWDVIPKCVPYGVPSVPYYMVFFVVGRLLVGRFRFEDMNSCSRFMFAIIFIIYCVGISFMPPPEQVIDSLACRLCFRLLAFIGIFISIMVAQRMRTEWICRFGVSSMGIMLIHKFIVIALMLKVPFAQKLMNVNLVLALSVCFLVVILSLLISYALTIGVEKFVPMILGRNKMGVQNEAKVI